jgi:hypothetical protein
MRRRTHKAAFSWLCLGLFAFVELGPFRGFVLCEMPSGEVTVEDDLNAARCRATLDARLFDTANGGTLSVTPASCVDRPVSLSVAEAAGSSTLSRPHETLPLASSVPALLSGSRVELSFERRPTSYGNAPRLLRSVVLLV